MWLSCERFDRDGRHKPTGALKACTSLVKGNKTSRNKPQSDMRFKDKGNIGTNSYGIRHGKLQYAVPIHEFYHFMAIQMVHGEPELCNMPNVN
jgi:hypothetical protein